jgi:hypothetical protein
VKHLRNTIVVVNVFYDLPSHTDSEPTEESMSLSDWTKSLYRRLIVSVNDVKHNSKRAWVKPGAIASETKSNHLGAS